jgi:hypothetical protein
MLLMLLTLLAFALLGLTRKPGAGTHIAVALVAGVLTVTYWLTGKI